MDRLEDCVSLYTRLEKKAREVEKYLEDSETALDKFVQEDKVQYPIELNIPVFFQILRPGDRKRAPSKFPTAKLFRPLFAYFFFFSLFQYNLHGVKIL